METQLRHRLNRFIKCALFILIKQNVYTWLTSTEITVVNLDTD